MTINTTRDCARTIMRALRCADAMSNEPRFKEAIAAVGAAIAIEDSRIERAAAAGLRHIERVRESEKQ